MPGGTSAFFQQSRESLAVEMFSSHPHPTDPRGVVYVRERISIQQNEIGNPSNLDGPQIIRSPHKFCRIDGGSLQCAQRRQARFHQQSEFIAQAESWKAVRIHSVSSRQHRHARFEERSREALLHMKDPSRHLILGLIPNPNLWRDTLGPPLSRFTPHVSKPRIGFEFPIVHTPPYPQHSQGRRLPRLVPAKFRQQRIAFPGIQTPECLGFNRACDASWAVTA